MDREEENALKSLVDRLNSTKPLSVKEADQLGRAFREAAIKRMLETGATHGAATGDHPMYNQSEADFRQHIKNTDNDLLTQISTFNFGLDRWFKFGETHPPYFPYRIAVIISKRKELDWEKRFLASYCRHFRDRIGNRDEKITQRALKKGAIS